MKDEETLEGTYVGFVNPRLWCSLVSGGVDAEVNAVCVLCVYMCVCVGVCRCVQVQGYCFFFFFFRQE